MRKTNYIIISYYTPNYAEYGNRLEQCCKRLRIQHDISRIAHPTGSSQYPWMNAVKWKPRFIHQKMVQYKGKYDGVVWVDADAMIHSNPRLFESIPKELAVFYLRWPTKEELLSGTMYWKITKKMIAFVDLWANEVMKAREHMTKPEQAILEKMLRPYNVSVYRLPAEYCQIHNWGSRSGREIVIEHFQASRTYRRSLDGRPLKRAERETARMRDARRAAKRRWERLKKAREAIPHKKVRRRTKRRLQALARARGQR